MSTTKTLAKGTAWGLFAVLSLKVLGWLYWVLLSRLVPAEEIGTFTSALSLVSIVILFSDLGLGAGSVGRYVPFYSGKGYFNHVRKVLRTSVAAGFVFSVVCMTAVIFYSGELAAFYHKPGMAGVFNILALYILAYNFHSISGGFLRGRKLIKLSSYVGSSQGLGKFLLTALLVILVGPYAENLAIAFVLSFVLSSVLGWVWSLREYNKLPESSDGVSSLKLLSETIPFGLTMVVLASMYLLNLNFDSVMLGHLLPADVNMRMVGIYALVVSFGTLANIFANSIGTIFHPLISELWAQEKSSEIEDVSETYLRWIAVLTTPVLLVILAYPTEILTVIYGSQYAEGSLAFVIYSVGLFVYSFSYPVQNTLSGMKRLDQTIRIVSVGLLANIVLNLLLIPQYTINGAAAASATSFILMTVFFIGIRKKTHTRVPADIYKPLAGGIATFVVVLVLRYFAAGCWNALIAASDIAGFLVLIVLFTLATTIYLASLVILRAFTKEDAEIVTAGMRRFGAPEGVTSRTMALMLRKRD